MLLVVSTTAPSRVSFDGVGSGTAAALAVVVSELVLAGVADAVATTAHAQLLLSQQLSAHRAVFA